LSANVSRRLKATKGHNTHRNNNSMLKFLFFIVFSTRSRPTFAAVHAALVNESKMSSKIYYDTKKIESDEIIHIGITRCLNFCFLSFSQRDRDRRGLVNESKMSSKIHYDTLCLLFLKMFVLRYFFFFRFWAQFYDTMFFSLQFSRKLYFNIKPVQRTFKVITFFRKLDFYNIR